MLRQIHRFWQKHGFLIVFICTIIFLLIYWFFWTCHNEKGTVSENSFYYDPSIKFSNNTKKKSPPTMSSGETICKQILEEIFERPFSKCRPHFLYNPVTKENLEIDLYNEDINLAVEYNGRQHYEYIPYFHQNSREKFHTQRYRDEMKKTLCKEKNLPLIIVPYTIPNHRIKAFLIDEIKKLGFKI